MIGILNISLIEMYYQADYVSLMRGVDVNVTSVTHISVW